ncbi:MAG: DUF4369 domain-containing protein [Bacteroidaceae bacterium]|nr:DUF4369 domain-containing protein [Bacteroidaceae bacterium]
MKRLLYLVSAVLLGLTSCQQKMDIQGKSSIPELEGRMLFLRVYADGDLQTLDSAEIIHGKFHFEGPVKDTTQMAFLFMGNESLMPLVLNGATPLEISISENERKVTGTALNDTLYAFIRRKSVIDRALAEIPRRESQMIFEGYDHDEIVMQLSQEAGIQQAKEDEMITRFIKDNMDNVLAPGVFMIVTSNFPYPMLNPQIEELVTLGSPTFLNDAYVQEFLRMARENMEKMNE